MKSIMLFLILSVSIIFSQETIIREFPGALLYYPELLPGSARNNAVGGASVANQYPDALSANANPALASLYSSRKNILFGFYPGSVQWLGSENLELNNTSIIAGYYFRNLYKELGVSVAAGYTSKSFKYTNSNQKEESDGFLLSAAINYYVTLSAGITFKSMNSDILPAYPEDKNILVENNVADWGLLLYVPVTKLAYNESLLSISGYNLRPHLNVSLGYTRKNTGSKTSIENAMYNYAYMPATSTLGYQVNFGFTSHSRTANFQMLNISFSLDADEQMYLDGFTDEYNLEHYSDDAKVKLNVWDNLVMMHSSDRVIIRRGWRLSFMETFSYARGVFDGANNRNRGTSGFGFSSKGIFKLLQREFGRNKIMNYVFNSLQFDYYISDFFKDEDVETRFYGLNFTFNYIIH